MFGATEKIGKPGGASRLKGGLLVTTRWQGNMSVPKTFAFLSTTTFNRNNFAFMDNGIDFSIKVALEWANMTSNWSTGSWEINLNVQFDNSLPTQTETVIESPDCTIANRIQNRFTRTEIGSKDASSGLYGASFSESFDPTTFSVCSAGDNYFKGTITLFAPNASKEDFIIDNPSINHLQSYTIEEV